MQGKPRRRVSRLQRAAAWAPQEPCMLPAVPPTCAGICLAITLSKMVGASLSAALQGRRGGNVSCQASGGSGRRRATPGPRAGVADRRPIACDHDWGVQASNALRMAARKPSSSAHLEAAAF